MRSPDVNAAEWDHGYFKWLCSLVACPREYVGLLKVLDGIEFRWSLEWDENRAYDGMEMRCAYHYIHGGSRKAMRKCGCSVLEMLVGTIWRADHAYGIDPERSYVDEWFWDAMANADLLQYWSDGDGSTDWDWQEVVEKVDAILDRKYSRDGSGGFWPNPKSRVDERKRDIWDQLGRWVGCHYPTLTVVDGI